MRHFRSGIFADLLVWFALALISSAWWLKTASAPAIAIIVWSLTGIVMLLWWCVPIVRSWVDSLPLRVLIALHLCRFVGFYFLVLSRDGRLPRAFAFPAGIGDVAVAIGALMLLSVPSLMRSPPTIAVWNIIGLTDILFVVFQALRCGLSDWGSMAALRELPLAILPTFAVPLILVSHVWIFVRLIRFNRSAV
jgi:hypothetical protein